MNKIKKTVLTVSGLLSLILGIIGVFVPVLPTTPFLLLSSFCFLRSSERLHKWLINHKLFGGYISDYVNKKPMPKRLIVVTIIFLWISLLSSILLIKNGLITIILILTGILVTVHILMMNRWKRNAEKKSLTFSELTSEHSDNNNS